MNTSADSIEVLFRLQHVAMTTKRELIEFFSDLWKENEKAGFGIGWDTRIMARKGNGLKRRCCT